MRLSQGLTHLIHQFELRIWIEFWLVFHHGCDNVRLYEKWKIKAITEDDFPFFTLNTKYSGKKSIYRVALWAFFT
jgi:hypothetical protein